MSEKLSINIATNLKRLREARQISQQRLSDVSGVPRPTLAHLESGAANPTLSVVLKVSEALQVRLEELLKQPVPVISHYTVQALPKRGRASTSTSIQLLAEASALFSFERILVKPQGRWNVKAAAPGERYHVYCDSGEVTLSAGNEACELGSGEVAVLGSEIGFTVTNASRRVTTLFRVVTPALHGT